LFFDVHGGSSIRISDIVSGARNWLEAKAEENGDGFVIATRQNAAAAALRRKGRKGRSNAFGGSSPGLT
jgi:hypothetical protein